MQKMSQYSIQFKNGTMTWKPTTPPAPVKSLSRHKAVNDRKHKGTNADKKKKPSAYNKGIEKQNENQTSFEVR